MNIGSALYPAIPHRLELLLDLFPLNFIRGAQTATVLIGFCLILLADNLRRRSRRALHVTVVLLIVSSALHVVKGLDLEEATVAAGLAASLLATREVYSIPSPIP